MRHALAYLVDVWVVGMLVWSVVVMWRDETRRRDEVRRLPRINTRPPTAAPRFTRDDPSPTPKQTRKVS